MKAKKINPKRTHSEKNDPRPLTSKVAFKRPLSAHERILRALKHRDALNRLNAVPGDDTFDTDLDPVDTPHQLVIDERSGREMTAGERVMLQQERVQAAKDVQTRLARERELATLKKLAGKGRGGPKAAKGGKSAHSRAEAEHDDSGEENE